jgi:hypothetical protein
VSVRERDESAVCKCLDMKTKLGLAGRDELIYIAGRPRAKSKRAKHFGARIYSNLAR